MIRSFRLRIALALVLLAGLALAVFGFGAYSLVRNARLDGLDAALRLAAEREATRAPGPRGQLEARLAASLGLESSDYLAIHIADRDGGEIFRSSHWPPGLDASRLEWPNGPDRRPQAQGWISSAQAQPLPHDPPPRRHPPPHGGPHRPPPGQAAPPRLEPAQAVAPAAEAMASKPPASVEPPAAEPAADVHTTDTAPIDAASPPPQGPGPPPRSRLVDHRQGNSHWRLALASTPRAQVMIGLDLTLIDKELGPLRRAFLLVLPLALGVLGLGAWLLSSRALAPLRRLTDATRRIELDALDQRIAPHAGDDAEFAELIELYNRMLARLQRSYEQARRFSADAAHELRTPLAIMQGHLERALQAAPAGSPLQQEIATVLDEVRRLAGVSRKLLLLAQADAGRLRLRREPFALSECLSGLADDARILGPELQVSTRIAPALGIEADPTLLKQALHNLIANAVKYNVAGGWLRIEAEGGRDSVSVRIGNSSPGIAHADRERLFERFFRGDAAHSGGSEGSGLGLALAREIARAHGGELALKVDDDGRVQATLSLPMPHQSAGSIS